VATGGGGLCVGGTSRKQEALWRQMKTRVLPLKASVIDQRPGATDAKSTTKACVGCVWRCVGSGGGCGACVGGWVHLHLQRLHEVKRHRTKAAAMA